MWSKWNENTTYKLIWAIAKATVLGKMFLAVNAYVRNKQILQVNNEVPNSKN